MIDERDIEARLRRVVERNGGLCMKWVCPGRSGVPDRLVFLPGGHLRVVELKRPQGGKVSTLQRYWRSRFERLGFEYRLIATDAQIEAFEAEVLKLLEATAYWKERQG